MAAPAGNGTKIASDFGLVPPEVFTTQSVMDYERRLREVITTQLPAHKRDDLIADINLAAKVFSPETKFQALEVIAFRFVSRCEMPTEKQPISEQERSDLLFWISNLRKIILSFNSFTGQNAFSTELRFIGGLENKTINAEDFQKTKTILTSLYQKVNGKSALINQALDLAGLVVEAKQQTALLTIAEEILSRKISQNVDSVEFDKFMADFINKVEAELPKQQSQ